MTTAKNNLHALLLEAIKNEDIDRVKKLIAEGANVRVKDKKEADAHEYLLNTAAETNNMELVTLLIDSGGDVNEKFTSSPLSIAAVDNHNIEMTRLLLDHGAEIDARLHSCPIIGHLTYKLQEQDKDAPQTSTLENDYEHIPLNDEQFNILALFIERGASLKLKRSDYPPTLLEGAILANDIRTVKLLLGKKVRPTQVSVLHSAQMCAYYGYIDMVRLLVENGMKANPKTAKGKRPSGLLAYAVAGGHIDMVKYLLEKKTKVNYVPNHASNSTCQLIFVPLEPIVATAIRYGHPDILLLLLEKGADPDSDPNAAEERTTSPIILAAEQDDLRAVELLIEHHADINASHLYIDTEAFTAIDKTALDIAKEHGNREIYALLEQNGGKAFESI